MASLAVAPFAATMQVKPALAQFGFFPHGMSVRHRAPRRLPRPGAPPEAERVVPMPVPRPVFPSDTPAPSLRQTPAPVAKPPASAPAGDLPPRPPVAPPTSPPVRQLPDAQKPPPPNVAPAPQKVPEPSVTEAPKVAPSGARLGEAPGQPQDDATCPARLKAQGIDVEAIAIGAQPDVRCTVVQAVRLSGLTIAGSSRIDFPDHPTLACVTAETFSHYVRDLLSPLAKGTYGAPVMSVWTGPGLECRARDHVVGAKLSAHGQGLAIDIAQVKLADGHLISVGEPKDAVEDAFQTASRAAACGYFHTALGPGTDSYHRNHWHFDLEVRGAHGDSKYCR